MVQEDAVVRHLHKGKSAVQLEARYRPLDVTVSHGRSKGGVPASRDRQCRRKALRALFLERSFDTSGVNELPSDGDKIPIDFCRYHAFPAACELCITDHAEEDRSNSRRKDPGGNASLRRKRKVQRPFCRTDCHALETRGAFGRANGHKLVHREQ